MRKMNKKLAIGILTGALILGGAGTLAFAETNGNGVGLLNFGQAKPYIEKMHPELSTQEQKEMFESCHGKEGTMRGNTENTNPQDMMNTL
jgi:hypothetical protein